MEAPSPALGVVPAEERGSPCRYRDSSGAERAEGGPFRGWLPNGSYPSIRDAFLEEWELSWREYQDHVI
jgi:hypothetical protein